MPTPNHTPETIDDTITLNPDNTVSLDFSADDPRTVPSQLPEAIIAEFADKVVPFYGCPNGRVDFPDGSTGERVINSAIGEEVRITCNHPEVTTKGTYRYPGGKLKCTENINHPPKN